MIAFNGVYKSYNTAHLAALRAGQQPDSTQDFALKNITCNIEQGAMCYLTGHSGAGKSTFLKLIAALETPTLGELFVGDHAVHSLKGRAIARLRQQIGIVFQEDHLLHDRSVFDNVALPLVISGRSRNDIRQRVTAALSHVALLDKATEFPDALSGGEKQRVGIARAVVNRPRVLIADEPTGNLDPTLSHYIIQLFQRFNQAGVTVLIATHDELLIQRCPYPVLTLHQGTLAAASAATSSNRQATSRSVTPGKANIQRRQQMGRTNSGNGVLPEK